MKGVAVAGMSLQKVGEFRCTSISIAFVDIFVGLQLNKYADNGHVGNHCLLRLYVQIAQIVFVIAAAVD